jgi:hypothetical protein
MDMMVATYITAGAFVLTGGLGGLFPLIADPARQRQKYMRFVRAEADSFQHEITPYLSPVSRDTEDFGCYLSMSSLVYLVEYEEDRQKRDAFKLIKTLARQDLDTTA